MLTIIQKEARVDAELKKKKKKVPTYRPATIYL